MEVFLPPQKKVVSPRVYYFEIPGSFDLFTLDLFPPVCWRIGSRGTDIYPKDDGPSPHPQLFYFKLNLTERRLFRFSLSLDGTK